MLAVMSDDKIHEEEFLSKRYGVPVLASIPNLRRGMGGVVYAANNSKGDDGNE